MIRFKPLCLFCLFFPILADGQLIKSETTSIRSNAIEWKMSELIRSKNVGNCIDGDPQLIDCKYGKALLFNGASDGIFLDLMPLARLKQFTIEAIIKPDSGGNFEQRFFHCGEIRGNRVLMELRSVQTNWYFDAFIKSGDQQKTLIDSTRLHPLNQWYHIAFVIDNGKQVTYINGKKELESAIEIVPLAEGKTSIGVRQNEQSWFKGAIYKIRISPEALNPVNFMKD
ncbi:MAG: LamG domain-containing protein [Bacteroidia bacterium]|nr:LamG domain-containing protein [Bacteroidia bacterium]